MNAADALDLLFEDTLLESHLRVGVDVLQAAATAYAEIAATRCDAIRTDMLHRRRYAEFIGRLNSARLEIYALARQRIFDEQRLALAMGDAAAFLVERRYAM